MRVLGIDPGYGRCGYAVLEGAGANPKLVTAGVIVTQAGDPQHLRIQEIANDISHLLDRYKPQQMAIENLYYKQNVTTGLRVAEVRGVLKYLAAEHGLQLTEPDPTQVKAAFSGNGKADKRAIQDMVERIFGVSGLIDDAADAIAVGWWGLQNARFIV